MGGADLHALGGNAYAVSMLPPADPGDAFGEAAGGSGGTLPYRAEMEAAFDTDFSGVRAVLGGADARLPLLRRNGGWVAQIDYGFRCVPWGGYHVLTSST